MDALFEGASAFAPDILGSELDVKHGGADLGMPHELLKGGQGTPLHGTGVKISQAQMKEVNIQPHKQNPEWNYSLLQHTGQSSSK